MQKLTELEGAALGMIATDGPCTPYRVRQFFRKSPSPYWSGSAGAIYPLVRRLEKQKLITAQPFPTGKRAASAYRTTEKGQRQLSQWIIDSGTSERTSGVPMDPLRTRVRFLAALSPDQQRKFLRSAQAQLRSFAGIVEQDCAAKKGGDVLSYLTARGALFMSRARVQWIQEVERTLLG